MIALLGAHSAACKKAQGLFLQVDLAARLCARPRALSALLREGVLIPCSPMDIQYCISDCLLQTGVQATLLPYQTPGIGCQSSNIAGNAVL